MGLPFFRSCSGVNCFSREATIIQMSRPSADLPSEIIFNSGAAATSFLSHATVSSYDGDRRKSLFSDGVIQGSFFETASAWLLPLQGTSGGRMAWLAASENWETLAAGVADGSAPNSRLAAIQTKIRQKKRFTF